jgi:hypothetical protein
MEVCVDEKDKRLSAQKRMSLTATTLIEVRRIDRRNRGTERFVTDGGRPSVQCSHLGGHFFTAK